MSYKKIEFQVHGDAQGSLIALEENKEIPFAIRRVYYIFNTQHNVVRGRHAHKDLEQVIICISGSCEFTLDDGENREVFQLSQPTTGLYVGNNVWREFTDLSNDCVVMVLASRPYTPTDYIRDYDEFIKEVKDKLVND
jgi:dTDP-4-dehydrorhamnose 3,5-epimerase-like enzyme